MSQEAKEQYKWDAAEEYAAKDFPHLIKTITQRISHSLA